MIDFSKDKEIIKNIEAVRRFNAEKERFVYILTFGCQQNFADTEKLYGIAAMMGYTPTQDVGSADLILFNTCAVREHAEDKALSLLGSVKAQKKRNGELLVGLVGCMCAEKTSVGRIKTDFHYVDFTIEPSLLHLLPSAVFTALSTRKRSFYYGTESFDFPECVPTLRQERHRGLVSVMYGCNNFCSYCIVPYTRGRERSRGSAEIINECVALINDGVKEIMLLGQNVNSYRSDIGFPELISAIARIEGDFIIRFMTSHPKDASDELIDAMAEYSPKIAPFFHLPMQSGSDRVLSAMNRRYTRERYMSVLGKIKEKIPGVALSTDIIVGFPGESEEDFLDTLSVLTEAEFDQVYAFIYSPRVGTSAAKLSDPTPREVKVERLSRLLSIQDEIAKKKNSALLGLTVRVLVDSEEIRQGKRVLTGKTDTAKPVHFESEFGQVGEFINVEITKACQSHLIGTERK